MKNVKRFLCIAAAALSAVSTCMFSSCENNDVKKQVLRIYNCEDYISNEEENDGEGYYSYDLITRFEEEYNVEIEYSTYGTNENLYNELEINPGSYDLVCPSDYMLMKMLKNNMCEQFTEDFFTDNEENYYYNGVSPYIKRLFENNGWDKYAACYMWGTMGFMYDPELTGDNEINFWTDLNNPAFSKKFTLKDSVRDTYFLAICYVYHDELIALKNDYESGIISADEYNAKITEIANKTDKESVTKVQAALRTLKKDVYGFEVDSGKNDIVTGKVWINFCWSGDAAYAIYEAAEENDKTLYFSIPEECTNIWFDGWVMPKGANVELAQKFLNFISRPENAISNMNYIGYTSSIATEEVLERVKNSYALDEDEITDDSVLFDLQYFFGEDSDATFYADADAANGILLAQYPTADIVNRSAMMQFFDDDANGRINMMWEDVKGAEIPMPAIIFIIATTLVILMAYILTKYGDSFVINKPKKGFKKIEK